MHLFITNGFANRRVKEYLQAFGKRSKRGQIGSKCQIQKLRKRNTSNEKQRRKRHNWSSGSLEGSVQLANVRIKPSEPQQF